MERHTAALFGSIAALAWVRASSLKPSIAVLLVLASVAILWWMVAAAPVVISVPIVAAAAMTWCLWLEKSRGRS